MTLALRTYSVVTRVSEQSAPLGAYHVGIQYAHPTAAVALGWLTPLERVPPGRDPVDAAAAQAAAHGLEVSGLWYLTDIGARAWLRRAQFDSLDSSARRA